MKKLIVVCILAAMALFCGCTKISEPEEEPVPTETTAAEPQPFPVTAGGLTFNSSPMRVGSLSPAITEMIFELGFGDRLVCRSIYCDHPEKAAEITEAGSSANPDIDAIISCAPEVLITQSPIANKDTVRLSEAGITVMNIPSPRSCEELCENYRILSKMFSGSISSDALAENAYRDLIAAFDEAKGSCRDIVFIMNITPDGISAATGDTFAGDFTARFGKNIAQSDTSLDLSYNELLEADPQVILLAHPLSTEDLDYDISSQLTAFEDGHVYVIDASLTERPTARLAGIVRSISDTVRSDTGGYSFTGGYAEIPENDEETQTEVSYDDDDEDEEYHTADVADD